MRAFYYHRLLQYGGPDGEAGAALRYLSQRYSMPNRKIAGVLTDVGASIPKLHLLFFSLSHKNHSLRIAFAARFISL